MSPSEDQAVMSAPVVVGELARERVLACLDDAVELARADLSANLDRLRDVLQDASDRIDALVLTRMAAQPSSRLTVTALAAARGEPVDEFLLIPFGDVVVERPVAGESFEFTRGHAEAAKRWFDQLGRKLAIDYEHQSFEQLNPRPDGLRPAAGWIGALEVRDDGLWAVDVAWTERARELLRNGEYRYFSPVIFWADEDRLEVAALGPVALTNDPAMHGVRPLAARREGAGGPWPQAQVASRCELDAAEAEIEILRKRLALQEADTFVERGMRLGKIVDSTSVDWRDDYLRDPEAAEERLARSPVLLPPGRMIALDRRGQAEAFPRAGSGLRRSRSGGGPTGVQPEDLAAYERAVAAGRVVGGEGNR